MFSAQNETESKTGMEQLMNRYKEMLEQECDWVELINQPLISQTYWIAIAAVKVNLNFVVKANVNIQIGAEMEYQVGKRYSFWLHLLGKNSGSSEIDLIDERFAFQFYVMGTLESRLESRRRSLSVYSAPILPASGQMWNSAHI